MGAGLFLFTVKTRLHAVAIDAELGLRLTLVGCQQRMDPHRLRSCLESRKPFFPMTGPVLPMTKFASSLLLCLAETRSGLTNIDRAALRPLSASVAPLY
jgi:hypothetical protein